MKPEEIKDTVLQCLHGVAPEADLTALGGSADLRETLDIDSMDFLRFVVALHDKLRVDIPERDYPAIRTVDACTTYLAARLDRPSSVKA